MEFLFFIGIIGQIAFVDSQLQFNLPNNNSSSPVSNISVTPVKHSVGAYAFKNDLVGAASYKNAKRQAGKLSSKQSSNPNSPKVKTYSGPNGYLQVEEDTPVKYSSSYHFTNDEPTKSYSTNKKGKYGDDGSKGSKGKRYSDDDYENSDDRIEARPQDDEEEYLADNYERGSSKRRSDDRKYNRRSKHDDEEDADYEEERDAVESRDRRERDRERSSNSKDRHYDDDRDTEYDREQRHRRRNYDEDRDNRRSSSDTDYRRRPLKYDDNDKDYDRGHDYVDPYPRNRRNKDRERSSSSREDDYDDEDDRRGSSDRRRKNRRRDDDDDYEYNYKDPFGADTVPNKEENRKRTRGFTSADTRDRD